MRATNPLSRDFSTRAKNETGTDRNAQTNNQKQDIYTRVTQAIVSAIEAGAGTYRMPWVVRQDRGFSPISVSTVKPYRGINTLVLWAQSQAKGYTSALWALTSNGSHSGGRFARVRRVHLSFTGARTNRRTRPRMTQKSVTPRGCLPKATRYSTWNKSKA